MCWVVRGTFYVLCDTFYVVRDTCYVLRVVFYVNVTSRSNTRARMVNQHPLSPSTHFRLNHKEHPEVKATAKFNPNGIS